MEEKYIRERISELRIKKGVSEYKMSLDLGHSKSYIQSISSGKSLPSMSEFLYICEYLGVTPKEFFDDQMQEPTLSHTLYQLTQDMPQEDMLILINTAKRMKVSQP